jgi:hypothetical protein
MDHICKYICKNIKLWEGNMKKNVENWI